MSEPNTRPEDTGIAFGGGAGNEFVREFEEQRTAARESGGTDGMIREEIMSIRPHSIEALSGAEKPAPEIDFSVDDEPETAPAEDILMRDGSDLVENPDRPYTGFRLPDSITSFSYLGSNVRVGEPIPLAPDEVFGEEAADPDDGEVSLVDGLSADEDDEDEYDYDYDYEDEDYYEEDEKPSGFKGVFSENGFLSAMTLILGGICAAFSVVYFITLFMRDMTIGNALAYPLNGYGYGYTVTFSSPLITFMKILLYLLPFTAIFFGAALIITDRQKQHYGKKMLIVIVILLLLAVGCAGYDMGFAHLLF